MIQHLCIGLLRRLGLLGRVQSALAARPEEDPVIAAHSFVARFEAQYGAQHPNFLLCSYREALQAALRDHKFLLVYLHSTKHQARRARQTNSLKCAPADARDCKQDTPAFCTGTLCHDAVVEFLSEQVLVWGGDVRHSDAFQARGDAFWLSCVRC